jgi:DNA repair protein RecO (recombination protein O)
MPQERSEAVVLRGVDFSETSRIVTFLTPDRGRMACMVKGARRRGSPMQATLDTMNRVELIYYWKDGRAVQQVNEASLLDGFGTIKADFEKAAFASLPLEFALKAAHENEPLQDLFITFLHGMESLKMWSGDTRTHACWQLARLLSVTGFEPMLDACAHCGAELRGSAKFSFDGGATCPSCRADRQIDADELAALRALMNNIDECPSGVRLGGAYRVLCEYAMRQLETDLHSVRVIDEMVR